MSKQTEALKLALEALENAQANVGNWWPDEIAAIREALAEQPAQQQEPVAWLWELTGEMTTDPDRADGMWLPLYTSQPVSKPWVGLTEQEHTDIAIQCGCMSADWVFYGATVERILKEKNS